MCNVAVRDFLSSLQRHRYAMGLFIMSLRQGIIWWPQEKKKQKQKTEVIEPDLISKYYNANNTKLCKTVKFQN